MPTTEQLRQLVQLGEQVRQLALDLDLNSIAFMAGMIVAESKWAHYQSVEDGVPEEDETPGQRMRAVGPASINRTTPRERSAAPPERRFGETSNVTQFLAYKKAQY